MDNSNIKIPKLRGSANYFSWSFLVQELMSRDSVDYVLVASRSDSPVSACHKLDKDDKLSRSQIVLNWGQASLLTVAGLLQSQAVSKDIWEKLKSSYLKVDLQAKLNIRNKLSTKEFDPTKNFQDHLNEFQMHCLDLARLGDEIAEADQVAFLLGSLPDPFHGVNALTGATGKDLDGVVNLIRSDLEYREARSSRSAKISGPTPAAREVRASNRRSQQPKGRGYRRNVFCCYCHKMGHIQAECRIRISDEKNGMQGGISKNKKKPPRKSKERKYPNFSENQSQKQAPTCFQALHLPSHPIWCKARTINLKPRLLSFLLGPTTSL